MSKQLVTIAETSHEDLAKIYVLARSPFRRDELAGVGVSLVFERPSLRTRASSIAAVQQLGGRVAVFTNDEIGLDDRESAEDVARTLSQTSRVIAARVRRHGVFERMRAATADNTSFINLLSDHTHPTQAIADVLTIADHYRDGDVHALKGLSVAYVGDATNVTRSLATALVGLGVHVTVAAPDGYQLSNDDCSAITARSQQGGTLTLCEKPGEAVAGCDVVYTDSWISMGLEAEAAERRRVFAPFQVNEALMALAPNAIFLHCLPAHRGEEVTDAVLDASSSKVWEQVRHRTSAMIGALRWIGESL